MDEQCSECDGTAIVSLLLQERRGARRVKYCEDCWAYFRKDIEWLFEPAKEGV